MLDFIAYKAGSFNVLQSRASFIKKWSNGSVLQTFLYFPYFCIARLDNKSYYKLRSITKVYINNMYST